MEKILIKFTGKEENWQCVDNMKNKTLKEWIIDNCDQILYENEVEEQYKNNNEFFKSDDLGINSRINSEYETPYELIQIFRYKDYKDIKEKTLEYDRFFWLNIDEFKRCFEPQDFEEIKKGCLGYEK